MAAEIFRRPNPGVGQSDVQAISGRTGWEYEHGETDAQIHAIEEIILSTREESGAAVDNDGRDDVTGAPLKGATFTFNVDKDGDVIIGTSWVVEGDGVVNLGSRFGLLEGYVWKTQLWIIDPEGNFATKEV